MGGREQLLNILTLVVLAMTVLTLICYALIAINPYLPINPFPPATQVAVVITGAPAASPTPRNVPATWTPTNTPTITPTPPPTFTPTTTTTPSPSPTFTSIPPTETSTPRVTRSPFPFTYELTYETPYYGCEWMGVAGLVQDLDGNALTGYPIHIWGGGIDAVVTSGNKQMYGDSGWEQFFNNEPLEINGVFRVQIHARDNPDHPPVSEEIILDFPGYCSKSMAFIVFTKNH